MKLSETLRSRGTTGIEEYRRFARLDLRLLSDRSQLESSDDNLDYNVCFNGDAVPLKFLRTLGDHQMAGSQLLGTDRIDVQVWHARNSAKCTGPIESTCARWLDSEDQRRASLFRQPTSRNQHVIGRGMSRRLLAGSDGDPTAIQFHAEPHGKPFVASPDCLCRPFNIAHTDGLVLCGIADRSVPLIGVDVERLDRRTDPELAQRYFSVPEIEYLNRCPDDSSRRQTFLRIWTLKESFIKAIGTGLRTPLADFAFEEIGSDRPTIRFLNPSLVDEWSWRFQVLAPRPGFIGAVAVACREGQSVEVGLNDFEALVAAGPAE